MTDIQSNIFCEAIENRDLAKARTVKKADRHNHGALGFQLSRLNKRYGIAIQPPPQQMKDIAEMDNYIKTVLRPFYDSPEKLAVAIELAFEEALNDGVSLLEMSIDCWFFRMFENNPSAFIDILKAAHQKIAPNITYKPEIGVSRNMSLDIAEALAFPLIESGYFKSIDLYGEELYINPKAFKPMFKLAEKHGLKKKVHTGEFGSAESIRYEVEVLEANEVQHGISAVNSREVMYWLRNNGIRLNICPTSNVKLMRTKSLSTHPIRELFEFGLDVTINSDDILLFGQTVTDEFINLYQTGLFSTSELDTIRLNGLRE